MFYHQVLNGSQILDLGQDESLLSGSCFSFRHHPLCHLLVDLHHPHLKVPVLLEQGLHAVEILWPKRNQLGHLKE
jgi:hypothetical protein